MVLEDRCFLLNMKSFIMFYDEGKSDIVLLEWFLKRLFTVNKHVGPQAERTNNDSVWTACN